MLLMEKKGTIIDDIVLSRQLAQHIPIMVYLPYNYSKLYTYPVLYVQDGQDYFTLGKLATTLDRLVEQQQIDKCIVVAVPVSSTRERLVRYHPRGSKHEEYKRFFAEELVSHMDQNYSTNPISGARAIMGESLGGTISMEIALQYPHTFRHVISQSGAFYGGTIERIQQFSASPGLLQLYLSIGTLETSVKTSAGNLDLVALNRQCKEAIQKKGIPLHYKEYTGDHTWALWQEDLPHALNVLWR